MQAQTPNLAPHPAAYYHYQRWEKGCRYYEARLHRDLFGWVITKNWGSIGMANGRVVNIPCANYREGIQLLQNIVQRRKTRKYTSVSDQTLQAKL